MIELHTFRAAFGQPTGTPFGVKVMILLKLARLDFEIVYQDDPRKAPKKKFPLIVDDGETVADSTFIRHHIERKYGFDFDKELTEQLKAASLGFQRLAEESLYWTLVSARWADDANWPIFRDAAFAHMAKPIRPLIAGMIRRSALKGLVAHGMGRHSLAEQQQIGVDNLAAISTWLGQKDYMHGAKATAVDASVGAMVAAIHADIFDTPIRRATHETPNLDAYARRIKQRFYPES